MQPVSSAGCDLRLLRPSPLVAAGSVPAGPASRRPACRPPASNQAPPQGRAGSGAFLIRMDRFLNRRTLASRVQRVRDADFCRKGAGSLLPNCRDPGFKPEPAQHRLAEFNRPDNTQSAGYAVVIGVIEVGQRQNIGSRDCLKETETDHLRGDAGLCMAPRCRGRNPGSQRRRSVRGYAQPLPRTASPQSPHIDLAAGSLLGDLQGRSLAAASNWSAPAASPSGRRFRSPLCRLNRGSRRDEALKSSCRPDPREDGRGHP